MYMVNYQGQNVDTVQRSLSISAPVAREGYVNGLTPGETYAISVTAASGAENATSGEQTITTRKFVTS